MFLTQCQCLYNLGWNSAQSHKSFTPRISPAEFLHFSDAAIDARMCPQALAENSVMRQLHRSLQPTRQ